MYSKAGGTYSLGSAIFSPPKRLVLNSYSGLRDRNFIDPLLEPKDGWWESSKALDSEGCFVVVNVVTYFCSHRRRRADDDSNWEVSRSYDRRCSVCTRNLI